MISYNIFRLYSFILYNFVLTSLKKENPKATCKVVFDVHLVVFWETIIFFFIAVTNEIYQSESKINKTCVITKDTHMHAPTFQ